MNITDVEDKIIARVREAGTSLREYVSQYESAFLADLQSLGCLLPDHLPRATEHIPEMIQLIGALMKRGIAYQAPDGSVYFRIEKYQAGAGPHRQLVHPNFHHVHPTHRLTSVDYP